MLTIRSRSSNRKLHANIVKAAGKEPLQSYEFLGGPQGNLLSTLREDFA
jgi:hypothetical protein